MAATDGDPRVVVDHFASLPIASEVVSHGVGKSTIVSPDGLQIDLRVVEPGCWGSAAMYFTGSKAHNIRLRQIAIDSGRTLSEYGLADSATGAVVAAQTEEEVYRALGLDWVPPELREDRGEVELAAMGRLPELVEERHVRGDLHVHTDVSGDGRATLETMVAAAERRGYEYVAITDHGENLAINGASREELLEQRQAVARLQHRHPDLRILQGCELNIGRDGGVDYDAGFLAGLDFGVAAVHGAFDLDEETQTRRVISAMENPAVNVIGHLTGRQIGRRPGIDLDLEAVFDAAERTGTALEVNCHLDRLDLSADALYLAREREVLFSIDTDAHDAAELDNLRWGVRTARRGWVERDRVVNTWPVGRFLEWVGAKRSG
jgi:DNA polymerase (family 10)